MTPNGLRSSRRTNGRRTDWNRHPPTSATSALEHSNRGSPVTPHPHPAIGGRRWWPPRWQLVPEWSACGCTTSHQLPTRSGTVGASAPNLAAGEVQHYLIRTQATDVGLADAGDWWLIDDKMIVVFHFEGLERVAVEVVDDESRLADARRWWQIAIDLTSGAND